MPHLPKTKTPVFLLEQTIEYRVYEHFVKSTPFFIKPFFLFDIWKLKKNEVDSWKKATQVGVVSHEDGLIIKKMVGKDPVVIPNAAGDEMIVKKIPKKSLSKSIIFFQGNFFWLQNIEAAKFLVNKIIPLAKEKIPDAVFVIAGQNAKNKLGLSKSKNLKIIDIKNEETTQVQDLYKKASLFLAPIFGPGGTRLKILAAMASGLPIVSTPIGISGLELEEKKHVLICQTPNDFIEKIEQLLKDKKLYRRLQKNAYLLIKKKYNWKKVAEKLEMVYQKILS